MVSVGGHSLRVQIRRSGSGSGTPLVLANGIGAPLEMLEPFVDALPGDVEVIRFDVPGVGGSAPAPRPYLLCQLARLVRRLLDELGYEAVDMLGISWGGGLAQQFALQHRSTCRRLVLVSTSPGNLMVPGSPRVLALMSTPRRYRDPEFARRIAGTIYGGSMRAHPETAARLLAHHSNRIGPARGYWMQLAAMTGWSSLPWLPFIHQPTLIVAGDDDPIVPLANARIMARLLPNARLHVVHDGHLALIAEAATLGPLVADFLADTAPVGTVKST